jgi:hypothetical protein
MICGVSVWEAVAVLVDPVLPLDVGRDTGERI